VAVIGIDPGGRGALRAGSASSENVEALPAYVEALDVSYPIGMEDPSTKTYEALAKNFKGLNPFPVDVIVGKDGRIAYIGREYDAAKMEAVIEAELAK
jgi:hypothetical protein